MFSVITWQDIFPLKSTLVHKDGAVFQFSLLGLKTISLSRCRGNRNWRALFRDFYTSKFLYVPRHHS